MELQQNQAVYFLMKPDVIPSIYWAIQAQNQKKNLQNLNKNWSKIENSPIEGAQ